MERYGVIYRIQNKINNKIYFGQTVNSFDVRYNGSLKSQTHNKFLKRSIEKYGIDNFNIDKEFDIGYSEEELNKLEDMYITKYDTTNRNFGYNMRGGGASGRITEEQKRKQSKTMKAKYASGEIKVWNEGTKGIMKAWNKGKINIYSKETLNQMSESRKGRFTGKDNPNYGNDKLKGKNHPMYNKRHSKDTIKKMSDAKLGKCIGEENPRALRILCITTGEVFDYILQASRKYGIDNSNITKCCRGKAKSAGKHPITGEKMVWRYHNTDW